MLWLRLMLGQQRLSPMLPNHALQRTEAGGWAFSVYHVCSRQPLSLSLSPLGPATFLLSWV